MSYTGRCNCGAVTAEISADPIATRQCWCRQCQKAAAGSATNNAIFPASAVALTGEVAAWDYVADSGNSLIQSFCPKCGSAVMAQSTARPHLRTLRMGFLDEPHGLRPEAVIWTDEAPAWAQIDPALPAFPRQPPPPPAQD
jgi:hypothetical protein